MIERGDSREVYRITGELVCREPFGRGSGPLVGGSESRWIMSRPCLFALYDPFISWLLAAVGGIAFAVLAFGPSLLSGDMLRSMGLSYQRDVRCSPPAYWLMALFALHLVVALLMIAFVPSMVFRLFVIGITVLNFMRLPRALWGFEIQGDTVRVWFPLWPSGNAVVTREQLVSAHGASAYRASPFRSELRIALANGRKLHLSAMGTARFRLLAEYVRGARG
jgi:hypothetical protein